LVRLLRSTRYIFRRRGIGADILVKKAFKLGIFSPRTIFDSQEF
jgi:hypothetical protein